jgi:protein-S-isoprenylcysteine O-methyltransferase Ste14
MPGGAESRVTQSPAALAAPSAGALVAFALGTAVALGYSWRSLRHPHSHGVPRFFAFEGILLLVLLNWPSWFSRPWSPIHLVSWTLLFGSLVPGVNGFLLLRRLGRATQPPADSHLHGFEHTNALVVTGVYRFIRHPLYASLLCLAWGAALKTASPPSLGLAVATSVFLWDTGRREERENIGRFGDAYREYMRRTRRFIPWIW